jgi:hypothetical protein
VVVGFDNRGSMSASRRALLHVFDACLTELEDANERDETVVSPSLADRIRPHVSALRPGMKITAALDLVFREQERCLARERDAAAAEPEPAAAEPLLDARGASDLTERIRAATRHVCLLLLEAHERGAAAALGYETWAHYVKQEFGLSRRRSYELLDQARVIRAIRDAGAVSGIPHISAYAAAELKANLDEVLETVRQEATGATESQRMDAVTRVVAAARAAIAAERRGRGSSQRHMVALSMTEPGARPSQRHLEDAVAVLARVGQEDMARLVRHAPIGLLQNLRPALERLSELVHAVEERVGRQLAS